MPISTSEINRLLLASGLSLFMATGAARAGGTPNDAAGALGHDAPSSAAPTQAVEEGRPDAKVLPYTVNENARPYEQRPSSESDQNE